MGDLAHRPPFRTTSHRNSCNFYSQLTILELPELALGKVGLQLGDTNAQLIMYEVTDMNDRVDARQKIRYTHVP